MVLGTLGKALIALACLLVFPSVVALIYGETAIWSFVITIAGSLALGFLFTLVGKTKNRVIYAREGFAIAALTWVLFSLIGALPFAISGEIPLYVDAFFETASGFSTTGASIVPDVEALSKSILFWRSFIHWVGGMGVLVFVMAIVPNVSERSIHILRAEVPGPTFGKIVPKIKESSKILYIIYLVMTIVEVILLIAGGMPFFESLLHSFGTAGTGGFGIKADSVGSYSPYLQWVIAIFMLLFGINFNLYYMILLKKIKSVFKSEELWAYLLIVLAATAVISVNIYDKFDGFWETVRHSFFQVSSIITTTGYSTVDFNLWPSLSKTIIIVLMFIGGCAGSTAGGIKVSRIVMFFKTVSRDIRKLLHPRSVNAVKLEGKTVDEKTVNSVSTYLVVYSICFMVILILISVDGYDFETNFSTVASCFNNIGPGLNLTGPMANFSIYSDFSTFVLSLAMLFGRLEIFPMLLLFSPKLWKKD